MCAREMCPDVSIDITGDVCPMTFVRVKLALERMPSGALLGVRLNAGEPLHNVPRSARAEGHEILTLMPEAAGSSVHYLVIRRC